MSAVDLFAGPGGWDVAARELGLDVVGVEFEKWACETRIAAGLDTIMSDVLLLNPLGFDQEGLIASPPCFVAGTPILTRRGCVFIEEVVVGDEVWTHENRWRVVTNTMTRMAETVRVGMITSTPDHLFYARSQSRQWNNVTRRSEWSLGSPSWVSAAALQGNFTATPLAVMYTETRWACSPWLAGRYVADGWTGRDGVMIAVGAGREEPAGEWRVSQSGASCRRFTRSDHALATHLSDEFGRGAGNKVIPTWVLAATEEERREFLRGYLSGDGHNLPGGRAGVTISSRLASMLYLLAVGLGYTSSIVRVDSGPTTVIEGRIVNQRPWYRVTFIENDGRYTRDVEGHRWAKVRKAPVPAGKAQVYDLTIEEDHSFIAWGRVVHNCQSFSAAGRGSGRAEMADVLAGVQALLVGEPLPEFSDPRTALSLEPLRWILARYNAGRPFEWIALEQVPGVLPLWEEYAKVLRDLGYYVAVANLHAEEFGVPQTRKRAILMARLDRSVALPASTHMRYRKGTPQTTVTPGLKPWVSMADALGWGMSRRPMALSGSTNFIGGSGSKKAIAFEMDAGAWSEPNVAVPGDSSWVHTRPSPTIVGSFAPDVVAAPGWRKAGDGPRQSQPGSIRVSIEEAGVLQSFPRDYPWQGPRTAQFRQVGNAIPPLLAKAILEEVTR